MFDRIKKALSRHLGSAEGADTLAAASAGSWAPMSEWAATQGFEFSSEQARQAFCVTGRVAGRPWRLELGPPSRSYVQGEELRARADLGFDGEVAVLLMSRHLKDTLQAQADRLPTHPHPSSPEPPLGEEMRWLAEYHEVDWVGPPLQFWSRYAVMASQREWAMEWLDSDLVRQLIAWPLPGVDPEVPFLLSLMHGRVFLRMEYRPSDLPTLQHAAGIFTNACESAADLMRRGKPTAGAVRPPPPGPLPAVAR